MAQADDWDGDLLAAAGRRRVTSQRKRARDSSDDGEPAELSADEGEDEMPRVTESKRARDESRAQARGEEEAGVEEEEEEDDDDDDSDDELPPGADPTLFYDKEDRQRLLRMREREREMILAERSMKRDHEDFRRTLKQQSRGGRDQQEAADAREEAGGLRKSERRPKDMSKKSSAIEELRAARERKEEKAQQLRRREEPSSEPGSDAEVADASGGDEDYRMEEAQAEEAWEEEGSGAAAEPLDEDAEDEDGYLAQDADADCYSDGEDEASYEEVTALQVTRDLLASWVDKPFFDDTLPGCIVRLGCGTRRDDSGSSVNRYLIAQVVQVSVDENRAYALDGRRAKVSRYLKVKYMDKVRRAGINLVSNGAITKEEYSEWHKCCIDFGMPHITTRQYQEVKERLDAAEQYKFTADDVRRIVEEKRSQGRGVMSLPMELARLQRQLALARDEDNAEQVEELEERLRQVEEQLERKREGGARRSEGLGAVNERNRKQNFAAMVRGTQPGESGAKDMGKAGQQGDPFQRRQTRPKIYWNTKRLAPTAAAGSSTPSEASAADRNAAGERGGSQTNGDGAGPCCTIQDILMQVQESGGAFAGLRLQLSVDTSFLERRDTAPPLAKLMLGPRWEFTTDKASALSQRYGKASLSIQDYKRRQGIIG